MKKDVLNILKATPEQYEMIVLNMFHSWCVMKSTNQTTLQKVLTCVPLFNWWYKQLTKLEVQFVDEAKEYADHITQSAAVDFYHQSTNGIYKIFSKPLIKKAYDTQTIGKQN